MLLLQIYYTQSALEWLLFFKLYELLSWYVMLHVHLFYDLILGDDGKLEL